MPLTVRETILQGLEAALSTIQAAIPTLVVKRNEDIEYEVFPILNMLDAEAQQRIDERHRGANTYALDLTIEGAVAGTVPADIGPALSALYGETIKALKAAEAGIPEILNLHEEDLDATLVRDEEGIAPHAVMSLELTIMFQASPEDPFTQPA